MSKRWKALLASLLTMGLVTVVGVVFVFRPLSEGDAVASPWPAPVAILVYLCLYVLLLDWAAQRMQSSYAAAGVIAAAQLIFIVDLLARGERGVMTALAGSLLVLATWACVAFVHARLTRSEPS